MTIEVPEWIVKDIVDNYDWELPEEAWTNDNKIDFNSQAFKDFVIKEIEAGYRNKMLSVAMNNFIFEWDNKLKPTPNFEIIFKGESDGRA